VSLALASDNSALPPLREDLQLLRGAPAADGSPTWTIHDVLSNRYFRIGRLAMEMLKRWSLAEADKILQRVGSETTLKPSSHDLNALVQFLHSNNLVRGDTPGARAAYNRQWQATHSHWLMWLLKNYLFLRIPLIRPDRFLAASYRWIKWLYSPVVACLLMFMAIMGLYLVIREWDTFAATIPRFLSLEGMVWYATALILIKVCHELGHAYTAFRYGCRVPTMGIAFLVMWPVLYTDTTDAWRLTSRRQKLAIGAAGIITELGIAVIATFLWGFLADGPVRDTAFFIATTSWVITLGINLNPFMRFDGYYLLSDWLGIENLQTRAFALARWRLRELLFKLGHPPPETLTASQRRGLTLYAWATWVYRLFLFIGIAALVYYFFFKVLGIILFVCEIVWFVARPVWNELKEWWRLRGDIKPSINSFILLCVLIGGTVLAVIPWRTHTELPALLTARTSINIYPPTAAQITAVFVQRGQTVDKDAPLIALHVPNLEHKVEAQQYRIEALSIRLQRARFDTNDLEQIDVLKQLMLSARTELNALLDIQSNLLVAAPLNGTVVEWADALEPGRWINTDERLGLLQSTDDATIKAFVDEENLSRLDTGYIGRFFPDDAAQTSLLAYISEIGESNIDELAKPYLSESYDGPFKTHVSEQGTEQLNTTVYPVTLKPTLSIHAPAQVTRGVVIVEGEAISIFERLYRSIAAVLIRESGF
jgi:putative peptide zinc metalloprotease protein